MDKKQELENEGVEFQAISTTLLKARMPNINYEIIKENHDIISIDYNGANISVGDSYNCNVTSRANSPEINYKINAITVNNADNRIINLFESIYNNTTIFALPFVFNIKRESGFVYKDNGINVGYLINSYVECMFEPKKCKYSIFALLKYMNSTGFKNQELVFRANKNFVRTIDVDTKHVIYEFSIPKEFRKDYDLLLYGKYSKLSKKAIDRILSFHEKGVEGIIAYNAMVKDAKSWQILADDFDMDIDEIGEVHKRFGPEDVLTKSML